MSEASLRVLEITTAPALTVCRENGGSMESIANSKSQPSLMVVSPFTVT